MQPLIPKEPQVPELNDYQIERLTEITFMPITKPQPCDVLFIFAGTHPGHWLKAIEAYKLGLAKQIIVTGGVSPTGVKHPDWKDPLTPEAYVIVEELVKSGISRLVMSIEDRSGNTLENVLFAKDVFDFETIRSVLFICKNHTAGRQYRTLAKHITNPITYIPFGFDAAYKGVTISRENWMETEIGRSRVYGEFLRIQHLGKIGHILPIEEQVFGLDEGAEG
ncbi:YdcF family protein [Paenibacillus sp. NPDC058174]|uniref:YdcF family protein n=1 Tax=Paenibacillus sp. NPDC058174 TaxID=3346366 RepID=UPI0036DF7057